MNNLAHRLLSIMMAMCMTLVCVVSVSATEVTSVDASEMVQNVVNPIEMGSGTSITTRTHGDFTITAAGKRLVLECYVGAPCMFTFELSKPDGTSMSHSMQFTQSGRQSFTLVNAPAQQGWYTYRFFFNRAGVVYNWQLSLL